MRNTGMSNSKKIALVAGATGVVERNLLKYLIDLDDWNVITVSRRKPEIEGNYKHISLDLIDSDACKAEADAFVPATHIFFASYVERLSWSEMVEPNVTMLRNFIEVVVSAAVNLQHVNLMHGTKWYSNHLGPFKTHAEESNP